MAGLPEETLTELQKLRTAITEKDRDDFEEAITALIEQNQVDAINHHFNFEGLNPLHLALSLNNQGNTILTYNALRELKISNDQKVQDLPNAQQHLALKLGGLEDAEHLRPNDNLFLTTRTYFVWRLFTLGINPNSNETNDNAYAALHRAILNNDAECFELLMAHPSINVNNLATGQILPIHLATLLQKNDQVCVLAEHGSKLNVKASNHGGINFLNPLPNDNGCTPLDIAIKRFYPESARILLEHGAGIGANIFGIDQLINERVLNVDHCPFFGAYRGHAGNPIRNDVHGFQNTAITLPWVEKQMTADSSWTESVFHQAKTEDDQAIVLLPRNDIGRQVRVTSKPAYPFLMNHANLQQRCFELLAEHPENQTYRRLSLYFGQFLSSHDSESSAPGTLRSRIVYELGSDKDYRSRAINSIVEKHFPEEKPNPTELLLNSGLNVCSEAVAKVNDEFKVDKFHNLHYMKQILQSFNHQLNNMNHSSYFDTYNNLLFNALIESSIRLLIYGGIGLLLEAVLGFILGFVLLLFTMPILPALCLAAISMGFSLAINFPIIASFGTGPAIFAFVKDTFEYIHSKINLINALSELSELVTIIPEIMEDATKALLANLLSGFFSKDDLHHFIQTYQAEIATRIGNDELLVNDYGDAPKVAPPAVNWQFYPPNREGNNDIEGNIDADLKAREIDLFDGYTY